MKSACALLVFVMISLAYHPPLFGQSASIQVEISVVDELLSAHEKEGRIFLFLDENESGEPRRRLWPMGTKKNHIFARNIAWNGANPFVISGGMRMSKTSDFSIKEVPHGTYQVQVLWDQDKLESRIDAPGNLHSIVTSVTIEEDMEIQIELDQAIPKRTVEIHPLLKEVTFKSDTLSSWWDRDYHLKATVMLPSSYNTESSRRYPIRYNVAGYGGRYNRSNNLVRPGSSFKSWWESDEAPQIINVFLDGEGPFGDSYQLDSETSGPFGYALIHELIPHIESEFRTMQSAKWRFVDGCSTGGWVSLALQLYYPDEFNGVWSYSPDAIEFENYQLVNIYEDDNLFVNEWGMERPLARDVTGDPIVTVRDFIQYENVLGYSNSYLNSGGQFSAHTALYSPKGSNGLPAPLFDPQTGLIDRTVAEHWKKYDMKILLQENWAELGPKLQGKIYIWMGDMDNFFLNPATRAFATYIESLTNPVSDAVIEFEAMQGHCTKFNHKDILLKMNDRIEQLEDE
jgi:hypothetical protein